MKTLEKINQLKYNMLTLSNAARGYSNCSATREVDRVEGELERLEAVYTGYVLNDDIKDEYILSELNKLVRNVNDDELNEWLEDSPEETYYNDASMTWIYDYIYNVFDDCETLDEIDCRISMLFGYYGDNYIVKNGDQFYIFLEW